MTQDEELARLERLLMLCTNRANSHTRSNKLDEKLTILRNRLPRISDEERERWLEEQRQRPSISEERRARWREEKRQTLNRK